jgi:hypothetical protein
MPPQKSKSDAPIDDGTVMMTAPVGTFACAVDGTTYLVDENGMIAAAPAHVARLAEIGCHF